MRASVRDISILKALKPLELVAYLRSTKWEKECEKSGVSSTWILNTEKEGEYEIALPMSHSLRDFPQRMADALAVLEVVEQRSQLDILHDLTISSADVIRVGLTDSDLADGSVPIEDGAQFFLKAKDMMLAAACAATETKAYYPSRKPSQATDYLRKVRLGQTEHGSFVLTIISRVDPALQGSNGQIFETDEPFERKVTHTLASSLALVLSAADKAASTAEIESFEDAVKGGVSANLCDAIVGMVDTSDCTRGMSVNFSWSRTRPIDKDSTVPNHITFSPDVIPFIKEASRYFKNHSPREGFELQGPVVKLQRDNSELSGKVTVFGIVDEQPRKITFVADKEDYDQAAKAHTNGEIVRCLGELEREGRTYRLENIRNFSVDDDDSE